MEHAIFINKATAARIAATFNADRKWSAAVRPATKRSQLLGYHVCLNGVNLTENEVGALS